MASFEGPGGDTNLAHSMAGKRQKYSEESLKPGNILLFGRVTYEMKWQVSGLRPWPVERFPWLPEEMNRAEKLVFRRR